MMQLSKLQKVQNVASPTFFCEPKYISKIDTSLINELEEFCRQEKKVVRICLHGSPTDDLHNMIIAHPKDWYVRPHANPNKTKTYHAIKGKMLFVGFDENQHELFREVLDTENTPILRLEKGVFIFIWALTDVFLFHEITIGPFKRDNDTIFATWAPQSSDLKLNIFIELILNERHKEKV